MLAVALYFGSTSEAHAQVVNYELTDTVGDTWVTQGAGSTSTGAVISGTFSFNWSTDLLVGTIDLTESAGSAGTGIAAGSITSTTIVSMGATDGILGYTNATIEHNKSPAAVFTQTAPTYTDTVEGTYYTFTQGVTQYVEIDAVIGGQYYFLDITPSLTDALFPGDITAGQAGGVYSSINGNYILASTESVQSQPVATPINTTGASMDSSNLGTTLYRISRAARW